MGQLTTDYRARAEQDFGIFYSAYQEPIVRYLVLKWLCDEDSAYDLCQETFKRFWKFLIDQETALQQTANYKKNWLYEVATNIAIDKLRRNKLVAFQSLPEDEELTVEGDEEWTIERLTLRKAIAQMSSQYWKCLRLSLCGFTYQEIAEKLGIKEKTVSANISRARTELRKKYYQVPVDIRIMETKAAFRQSGLYSIPLKHTDSDQWCDKNCFYPELGDPVCGPTTMTLLQMDDDEFKRKVFGEYELDWVRINRAIKNPSNELLSPIPQWLADKLPIPRIPHQP